jgi:hypothetical protein
VTPQSAPSELPDRAFAGAEAYEYADQAVFTGREEESEKLLRLITIYRGVLLYGPAGVGKTSLVYAGFLPKAVRDGYVVARVRLNPQPGAEFVVERIPLKNDGKPPYLPWLFQDVPDDQPNRTMSAAELKQAVRERQQDGFPLLIFDHFEQFVTLFASRIGTASLGGLVGDATAGRLPAKEAIADFIIRTGMDHSLRVKMLFAFREEYLAELQKLFIRAPDLMDITFRLAPLKTDELERILTEPFRRFPGHFPRQIPDDVAGKLSTAVKERSGTGDLNLTSVGLTAQRLIETANPEAMLDTGIHEIVTGSTTGMYPALPQPAAPPRSAVPVPQAQASRLATTLWVLIGAAATLVVIAAIWMLFRTSGETPIEPPATGAQAQLDPNVTELKELRARVKALETKEATAGEQVKTTVAERGGRTGRATVAAPVMVAPCTDPEPFRLRRNWVRSFRMGRMPVHLALNEVRREGIGGYVFATAAPWWQEGWIERPDEIPRRMTPAGDGRLNLGMFARCTARPGQNCEARLAAGWNLRLRLVRVAGDEAVMEVCAAQ